MKGATCEIKDCLASAGQGCHRGRELTECPHWGLSAVKKPSEVYPKNGTSHGWSGLGMGLSDIAIVAARNKPKVFGIVGPHNAGKTTILGMIYLLLKHGKRIGPASFAGSYSFTGWEGIARHLQWKGDIPPAFPPHTELSESRVPALLHFALRAPEEKLNDWLFTDAPGEWFKRWSLDVNAPDARGAVWVAEHSDVFLLVVDSEALASEDRGRARENYKTLIDRMAQVHDGRPVGLLWSKSDKAVPSSAAASVREYFDRKKFLTEEFRLSVIEEDGKYTASVSEFERLLSWMYSSTAKRLIVPPAFSVAPDDFFLSYRG